MAKYNFIRTTCLLAFTTLALAAAPALAATGSGGGGKASCNPINLGLNPNPFKAGLPTTNTDAQREQYFYQACWYEFGHPETNCLLITPPTDVGLDGYIGGVEWDFYESGCGLLGGGTTPPARQ